MHSQDHSHIKHLERKASIFWREINPKAHSCLQLKKLLEVYATFENWESVVQFSSRAVLHLNKNYEKVDFYYIWICALNEMKDEASLCLLAKHLLQMGSDYSVFNCLAIIAYQFAGKNDIGLSLLKEQKKHFNAKNKFYREALGLFLTSLKNKKYIKNGIVILKKLCSDKNSSYYTWRNCLRVLSHFNCERSMSRVYNLMNVKFPFAHEPYIISALIAMSEEKWLESIRLLNQVLKDNPENTDAILALSQCYEEYGDVESATDLMCKNARFFHDQDYDYNYTMARLLKKCAKLKDDKEKCEDSILYYDRVISLSYFFKFPVERLLADREEVYALNKALSNKAKLLLSLENFLKEKEPLNISSLARFKTPGCNLKFLA